jgi:predicted Zn-dependent peptidase
MVVCCLPALVSVFNVAAQAREATGLQTFVLDNGLQVFVVENHTVPLARIQVTFRTGAISQSPETAGLFHLYEHMLFKGNRAYPNQTALQAAMKDLGVAASFGDITVFRTTVPERVKPLVDQAIAVLASGRSMSGSVTVSAAGKSGLGSTAAAAAAAFVPVAEALPFCKLKFLTQFSSGQQTNRLVASQIAGSIFYHGDYRNYLLLIDRIGSVTADDVVRVAKKYLVDNPMLWIALGDPALLKDVNRDDFLKYTAN